MAKLAQFYVVLLLAISLVGFSISQSSPLVTSLSPVPQLGSDLLLYSSAPIPTLGPAPMHSPMNQSPSPSPSSPPLAPSLSSTPTPTSTLSADDATASDVNSKESSDSNHSSCGRMSGGKKIRITIGVIFTLGAFW